MNDKGEKQQLRQELTFMKIQLDVQQSHLKRINSLSQLLTSTLNIKKIFSLLMDSMENILNFDIGVVYLKKNDYFEIIEKKNNTENEFLFLEKIEIKKNNYFEKIIKNKESLFIEKKDSLENDFVPNNIISFMFVPIIYNKEVNAIVIFGSMIEGVFTTEEMEIASSLVGQAGIAIQNAKLYSELENRNQELDDMLKKLKNTQEKLLSNEKMAALGRIVGGIAHEMNSPLGGIQTSLQLLDLDINLIEDLNLKKEMKENTSYIELGVKKLTGIISKLKDISIENKIKNYQILELKDIINIIYNMYFENYKKYDINLKIVKEESLKIKGIKTEIMKVIEMIIDNSKDAILEKDIDNGQINLELYSDKDKIYIKIKDNGIGIKDENKNLVFDPFFTTKDVSKGIGLGLTQAYDIIKKHSGEIILNSKYGVGTDVTIYFEKKTYIY